MVLPAFFKDPIRLRRNSPGEGNDYLIKNIHTIGNHCKHFLKKKIFKIFQALKN